MFDKLAQLEASSAREAAMISKTAGVLFSAGKGIFNGLTGWLSYDRLLHCHFDFCLSKFYFVFHLCKLPSAQLGAN